MTKLFRLEKQQVLKMKSQPEVPALSSYQQGYQTALRQINLEQRMRTVQPEISQVKISSKVLKKFFFQKNFVEYKNYTNNKKI